MEISPLVEVPPPPLENVTIEKVHTKKVSVKDHFVSNLFLEQQACHQFEENKSVHPLLPDHFKWRVCNH